VLDSLDKAQEDVPWEYDKRGFPVAKPCDQPPMTLDEIQKCIDDADAGDDERAVQIAMGQQ
jgi:hypothetical protein